MADITELLNRLAEGVDLSQEELLNALYEELRGMAQSRIRFESPDCTLQATALVNEAYLRLVGDGGRSWQNRGQFFASAAIVMRRILVDEARKRNASKRGGNFQKQSLRDIAGQGSDGLSVIAVDEALEKLEQTDPEAAKLVSLRYFAGLTIKESAAILGISPRKANQLWAYAKAWLTVELED